MHYYTNESGNKIIGVENGMVTEFSLLFTRDATTGVQFNVPTIDEQKEVIPEASNVKKPTIKIVNGDKEAKKAYAKEWYHKNKAKSAKVKEANKNVSFEPNMKLIQEYGKSTIDAMIKCKREGMTVEEIDSDQPRGIGHLTFGQIETLYDIVVLA